jgi:hypothetical protein
VARLKTRVTVEGIADVQSRIKDPRLLQEPMQEYLTEASDIARRAAVGAMDGGTDKAVRSLGAKVTPLAARVFSAMATPRSRSIDQGRKPGASLKALLPGIIRWREAVHHPDSAIVIAKGIQRRGVKGRFFKRAAVEAVTNAQPRLRDELLGKLRGQWKRGKGL